MTAEAKFSEVVEAVRQAALGRLPEEQPVEFASQFIEEVRVLLNLNFSGRDGMYARQDRDKFAGQVGRALDKLASADSRVLVKSGQGRGNIRYWSPSAWEAYQSLEADRKAAKIALDARKTNIYDRIRRLNGDAQFYVTTPGRITMDLDTAAALLDLAEGD
jgi:hypothetical protein